MMHGGPAGAQGSEVISIADARARLLAGDVRPVTVRGEVTFSSQRLGLAFVQDSTGGIGFDPRTRKLPFALPGEWVEISGVVAERESVVMLVGNAKGLGAPKVSLLGESGRPVEPVPFDLTDAGQLHVDGMVLESEGIVRQVQVPTIEDAPMLVHVSSPAGVVTVRLPWRDAPETTSSWLNQHVKFRGVLVSRAPLRLMGREADACVLVRGRLHWKLQPQVLESVFQSAPLTTLREVTAATPVGGARRLHLTGVVTACKSRSWLTLRLGDASVQLFTRQTMAFAAGDRVSAVCWPQARQGGIALLDAVCRRLEAGPVPAPTLLSDLKSAAKSHADLVRIRGMLRNESLSAANPLLRLNPQHGPGCSIAWLPFLRADDFSTMESGSIVDLTGILTVHRVQDSEFAVSITPRTAVDVQVISGPAWWTRKRVLTALGLSGGIALLALGTAVASRWTIRRQRRQLSEIEAKMIATEERRRISREFHDSLQQQLAGAALHLETIKGAVSAAPELVARLVDDTSAMIRHCQVEARHSIWDLRTEMPVHEGLAEAVAEWLHVRSTQIKSPVLNFIAESAVSPLPEEQAFHVMRITQEAVNNAIAHSGASLISVRMGRSDGVLTVTIADDGSGFQAGERAGGDAAHFGLQSMNERARKIGAELRIISSLNQGTQVTLRLPDAAPSRNKYAHPT